MEEEGTYSILEYMGHDGQQQMAELFGTQRQAITKHLKNIFECGELNRQATCSILELVQKECICRCATH